MLTSSDVATFTRFRFSPSFPFTTDAYSKRPKFVHVVAGYLLNNLRIRNRKFLRMPPSKAQLRFERVFAGRTRPVPSELGETHITETQIDFTRVAQNNGLRTSASDTGTAQQIDSISASLRAEPRAEEVSNFEKTATCVHDGTAAELQQGRNTSSTTTVVDDRIVKDMAFRTYSEPVSSSTELVGRFCLFNQVVKFNRQYMDDSDDRVRQEFFAGKQIYARNWDMYVLWLFGRSPAENLLILCPSEPQLTLFLDTTSRHPTS